MEKRNVTYPVLLAASVLGNVLLVANGDTFQVSIVADITPAEVEVTGRDKDLLAAQLANAGNPATITCGLHKYRNRRDPVVRCTNGGRVDFLLDDELADGWDGDKNYTDRAGVIHVRDVE